MSIRRPDYPIDTLFFKRWSARAMTGEPITDEQLMSLFEAARWAPSSYNGQPWRFVYAKCKTPHFETFLSLMVPFNQSWAHTAAVLVVLISRDTFTWDNKTARTHSFDTGAAWQNICLQGHLMGLVVHGMEGFDYEKARHDLHIPIGYTIEAMCAIGKPGRKEDLPADLQKREEPSQRNLVSSFVREGTFTF